MPQWTNDQLRAIDSRDGTILVSAAAGSGKTAVLVERVIRRLEDKDKPCSADKLLIVTFTKAATAQMKEKISKELDKRLKENPGDSNLLRQRMLLPFAHICTIDSFCGEIVRDNFFALGISPDFRMLDETELAVMKSEAAQRAVEDCYAEKDEGFMRLADLFIKGSDDSALIELVISLYDNSRAFPFPEKWLDSLTAPYESNEGAAESIWGRLIIERLLLAADYSAEILTSAYDSLNKDDPETAAKIKEFYDGYLSFINSFTNAAKSSDWNSLCRCAQSFEKGRLTFPRGYDSVYAQNFKNARAEVADIFDSKVPKLLCCTDEQFKDDRGFMLPVVKKLVEIVKRFGEEFSALKTAADGADFSDVVAFALKLLIKDVDSLGNPVKTQLAQEISMQYDEILIDEFQDINETQNFLFKAISKDENNLFMVGDVKQSIYRFRLAMPEIFLNRRKSLNEFEESNYPAKITLGYNFRSRKGVTDYVNFVFSQLMSERAGGLDYDGGEELKSKAAFSQHDYPDSQLHILSGIDAKTDRALEAEYIAKYIKDAVNSGMTVKDGESERPVRLGDFCILLRSTKNKAEIYSKVLSENGISCCSPGSGGFFDSTEIKTILSIMRTVDNPVQDIPLVTTLMSPVFGFTPDEMSRLRINKPIGSVYDCVRNAADNSDKKCAAFLDFLRRLRSLSATLGASDFIRELLDLTGYDSTVLAMPGGERRKANLELLLEYAEKYEKGGCVGLSGFLRFIDKVQRQGKDFEVADQMSDSADAVRIMSIHKSKGLEFPVCILADCSSKFNDDYLKSNAAFHSKYGIAFKRIDSGRKFDTLAQKAIHTAQGTAELSEELRVLYVAMTRAKERLLCVVRCDNPDKKLSGISSSVTKDKKIHPYRVISSGSMGDWLLLSSIRHKTAFDLLNKPDFSLDGEENDFPLEIKQVDFSLEDGECAESETIETAEPDAELKETIAGRLSYEYPYAPLSSLVAKVSPSSLEKSADFMKYFASAKPKFLSPDGATPASKGTAVHKFMEFYDWSQKNLTASQQAEIMVKNNKLLRSEADILDYPMLDRFFNSETAKRIFSSGNIVREKKVTFTVPVGDIYGEMAEFSDSEKVLVQGYIDCAFEEDGEWVIVDYKTDRVSEISQLVERYHSQLKMYERALSECTGKRVKETLIYSLHLSQYISI
ncbi:MAG: helicase-exonuclease AddAB subunit AddA [Acutalibacteraceae bacterium]